MGDEGDDRTPFQIDRARIEASGKWPPSWGPFHRHFANDAIHRDGGPECDQPGTPRRVYAFDPDYLTEHEAIVAKWGADRAAAEVYADLQQLIKDYSVPGRDVIALMPFAATLDQLFGEKYGLES